VTSQQKPKKRNILAISGIRTFATLWIVLGHFQQTGFRFNADTTFLLPLNRGYIAVAVYIVLSGFVTHYAYRHKSYGNAKLLCGFYVRRMGRVLFTYWASCILGLLDPLFTRHDALATDFPGQAFATIFVIQSWFEFPSNTAWSRDTMHQPNPGGWTISTLVFAWLLYPLLNVWMRMFNRKTRGSIPAKLILGLLVYVLGMLPTTLIFVYQDGSITNQEFEFLYKFPPCRLFDFIIGMIAAELVDDVRVNKFAIWKYVTDFAVIALALISCVGDFNKQDLTTADGILEQPLIRMNAEAFLISGLSPLIAFVLLGYSIATGDETHRFTLRGILEHPVSSGLGTYSFAIYCFQFTLYFMFEAWQHAKLMVPTYMNYPARLFAAYLMPYLVALVIFSGVWTEWVERPFAKRLVAFTKRYFEEAPRKPCGDMTETPSRKMEHGNNISISLSHNLELYAREQAMFSEQRERGEQQQQPDLDEQEFMSFSIDSPDDNTDTEDDLEAARSFEYDGASEGGSARSTRHTTATA